MKNISSKVISVIIATIIAITSFPTSVFAANTADDVIAIAQNEIGYKQSSNGYTKYGDAYGFPYSAWCQTFVSWCCDEAGVPTSVVKRGAYCPTIANWFKKNSTWYDSEYHGGTYIPKKGDLIFFRWNNGSGVNHVGFVEYVQDGIVHTIEGNTSYKVARRSYYLSSKSILGYGVPAYDDSYKLVAPEVAVSVDGQIATVSWNLVKNATRYDVRLCYADGTSIYDHWGDSANESYIRFKMDPGQYKVAVCSANDTGFVYCDAIYFTVEPEPLAAPDLKISVDGENVTFSWNKIPSATHYDLRVYYADGTPLFDNWGGDENEVNLTYKFNPGNYRAQVCSANDSGFVYCDLVYFTVNSKSFEEYSAVSVSEGICYFSPLCAPNSCIDSEGGEVLYDNYNHNIHLWEYLGNANQQFYIEYAGEKDGKKLYYIKNTLTNQYLIMDNNKNLTESGHKISLSKWYFLDCGNGYYKIINYFNNLAIDICGGESSNGTNAWLYDPSDMSNAAQLFKLNYVD